MSYKKKSNKLIDMYQNVSNDYLEELSKHKYKCKVCGRKVFIHRLKDYAVCDYCGHNVFKNDKLEFQYRMKQALKKVED